MCPLQSAKIDLFTDQREVGEKEEEGMEDWDQETLEKAIAQKHGKDNKNMATNIICRYFLNAVEGRQYGWYVRAPTRQCSTVGALVQTGKHSFESF